MSSSGWAAVRKQLKTMSSEELIEALKDLHKALPDSRAFLNARYGAESLGEQILDPYLNKITGQFVIRNGAADPKISVARKVISEYRKATEDPAGALELLLTLIDEGCDFSATYGGMSESYHRQLFDVVDDMVALLEKKGPPLYAMYRERILRLKYYRDHVGWELGDYLYAEVEDLDATLGEKKAQPD